MPADRRGGLGVQSPLVQRGLDARMPKVVAFPEHRLAQVDRQRIREAIPEVQPGPVAAAFAEICVGLAGQAGLALVPTCPRSRREPTLIVKQRAVVQPLGLWAHPTGGLVADGQEPGREIIPLQSNQTLVHRGRHSLGLGLTRDFRDLLDRFVDRLILDVQSHVGTFLPS